MIKRIVAALIACAIGFSGVVAFIDTSSYAAATTVTIRAGKKEYYGINNFHTTWKWATHINGEPVDLDEELDVGRSYAYCVQPSKDTPPPGTYNVTVIDDDNTGRTEKMRKLIYYLPGGYGYKAVTKNKWFTKSVEGCSNYALGHIALSYVYDNCSGSSDAWIGTGSAVKSKVKSMINDLNNLPDPPDEFEVFWIKLSGYQDILGAIYATEYGKASVKKISSNPLITNGNDCYTLAGAQYTLYKDQACTEAAKTKSGSTAVITIKADGTSDEITVETGDYYIKETKAPRGYALDTGIHSLQITRDKTTLYSASDIPKSNPVGIIIQKVDKETGTNKAQGLASLQNAEFTITYYDVTPNADMSDDDLREAISEEEPGQINGKAAVWTFRTDKEGKINFAEPNNYLVKEKSADMYTDSKGQYVLPIGIITITETIAPRGYKKNEEVFIRSIQEIGEVESLQTLQTLCDSDSVQEQVYRGDITFSKSYDGEERMKNVPFRITSKTTGESHIIYTDENGYANTASSWNPHTQNTNAGKSSWDGIWFNGYNDVACGASVDNKLGALPYDRYELQELRCEANKGYELINDTITIQRDSVLIDLGTFDDKEYPKTREVISSEHASPKHTGYVKTGDEEIPVEYYIALFLLALCEIVILTTLFKNGRLNTNKDKKRQEIAEEYNAGSIPHSWM